jgi:uncharacterized protein DUF4019
MADYAIGDRRVLEGMSGIAPSGSARASRARPAPPARRALLATLALALLAAASVALAQDPRATAAQRVAREWLALTDKANAAAAWKAASPRFQQAMPMTQWATLLQSQRGPRGALVQRTIQGTSFRTQSPGLPDGIYATVQYRTSFEKEPNAAEQITLEQAADGSWRVIGYLIR